MLEIDEGWNFKPIDRPLCEKESGGETVKSTEADASAEVTTSAFVARDPLYDLSNLILPPGTSSQLQTLKARFERHALVYYEWGLAKTDPCGKHIAFNLYGPPGTGKTMCVEAVAGLFGKKLIDVSYAEIESKYVGETGKNIASAFAAAQAQDAVLFFDEADSILGQRMTSVTQAADQAVNVARAVMLKQLDAFDGIVAFATNLARNFDTAFVRRIPVHIEIPLPDREGRKRIAEVLVPAGVPFRSKIAFDRIADVTEGMSGGDLKNVVVNAICALAAIDWSCLDSKAITDEFIEQAKVTQKAKANVGRGMISETSEEIEL